MKLRQSKAAGGGMSVAPGTSNSSRAIKSKLLLDLLAWFFLLVNKISRVAGSGRHYTLLETINVRRIKLDIFIYIY